MGKFTEYIGSQFGNPHGFVGKICCITSEIFHMIDYIYDHLNTFHLLLDASYGTKFQNFVDEFIRIETEYTYKWMEATGCRIETEGDITKNLLHIINTSYFEGVFEIIRHDMSRDEAKKYMIC